ncbi:MAG TPA: hypothetical protein VGO93_16760 [Candidatus Xenobia bacterium]
MKRSATAATPETLTVQRLVLAAPDGSPRMEMSVGKHGMPTLRMFDPAGTCRVEVGLECTDTGESTWPHVQFNDSKGRWAFEFSPCDQNVLAGLRVAGVKLWDVDLDLARLSNAFTCGRS